MRPDELPDDPDIDALLSALDHPVPPVSAETVIAHARTSSGEEPKRLRWAAGIVIALGLSAGVAYALPGSPVGQWMREVGLRLGIGGPEGAAIPQVAAPDTSGVAFDVRDDAVIRFVTEGLSGYVRVELTDGPEVVTRAPSRTTRFVSDPERLLIEHPTADTVHIDIPRGAPHVEIQIGTRRVLIKEGADVATSAPADSAGRWLIRLDDGAP